LNTIKSNRIPHISPKKVTKFTTIKKGFTQYLGQKERGEGKSARPQPIFGSRIVKKKWGCEGCRMKSEKLFGLNLFNNLEKHNYFTQSLFDIKKTLP
jgi:hypothetical protein